MNPSAPTERAADAGPRFPWLVLLAPLLASAATRELWAPDEPRYSQVAKEIFERGDPLVLHLCGAVYPNKPPLGFALAGLSGRLGGWSELALRLPSIAAVAATAWLTARFARRAWGESEARWSAAIYLTTAMIVWNGARVQLDALLGLACFGALTLLDEPARDERDARHRARWAGVLTGLGVLVKGPVAYLFVALPLVVWRLLLGPRPGARSRRGAIEGGLAALALPLAWAAAAIAREPSLLDELLFRQHVGQTMDGTRHPEPFWFHLAVQPVWILPWSFAFLAGLGRAARAWSERRAGRAGDEGILRAASWFLATLVVFSCFTSKRDLYLVPVYPAVGLVVARWLVESLRGARASRVTSIATALSLVLVGLAVALAPSVADRFDERTAAVLGSLGWRAPASGGVLALLALSALVQGWRGRLRRSIEQSTLAFACGSLALALWIFPAINPTKSARSLAQAVAARPEKPETIPVVGAQPEGYRFYGAPAVALADVDASSGIDDALEREGSEFLLLIEARRFEKLPAESKVRLIELQRDSVGSRTMLLVGKRLD